MSRSGYYEDDYGVDQWAVIRWQGAVHSAKRGKRGQKFFRDLLTALDALPEPRLIADELEAATGQVCALGALGRARDLPMGDLDPEDPDSVAAAFDIASALSREVVYVNDEWGPHNETPEQRFVRVRKWVVRQIRL